MAALLSLLEVHAFVNTRGWKEDWAAGDNAVKQTHTCLSLRMQEVELGHSSRLLLSKWVCAPYLSVVWFPSSCHVTQDGFVVHTDTLLTPTSPNQQLKSRDFFVFVSLELFFDIVQILAGDLSGYASSSLFIHVRTDGSDDWGHFDMAVCDRCLLYVELPSPDFGWFWSRFRQSAITMACGSEVLEKLEAWKNAVRRPSTSLNSAKSGMAAGFLVSATLP